MHRLRNGADSGWWRADIEQIADRSGEYLRCEGFLQETARAFFLSGHDTEVIHISRYEQGSQIRLNDGQVLCQFPSTHTWHDDIG